MKTAACYIRVSTDDQTEYSPDSQLKLIKDYAFKHNISLIDDYIFAEDGGKSGKNMSRRTEFMKLISLTKRKPKPFDVILVWKFSRFARNQEESIVLKSMLKKNDIDVISISESLPDGPFGTLVERIIEWSDEYYLVNLAQEVKRGMRERAERGLPVCPPPIGYDMKDGQYIPNSDAQFVKSIFRDYLNGLGMRAIAEKYGKMGLKTKRGNLPDNRCIEYMLCNPVYIGKIRWSAEGRAASRRKYNAPNIIVSDGVHEPLISKEDFERVQNLIADTKKKYGRYQRPEQTFQYMLKGLVRCSACGATLIASNPQCPTMQCHNYAKGKCHTSHGILISKANQAVISYLQNAAISDDIKIESKETAPDTNETDYKKILENEYKKLERIKSAYQNGIDTLAEYKANKEQITAFIEKVKTEMLATSPKAKKNNIKALQKKITDVLKIVIDPKQPEAAKNSALRLIVSKIVYIKKENRFEVYFYM